jgi:hypothetical protein
MDKFEERILKDLGAEIVNMLIEKDRLYGASWKSHGGFSAFFNMDRKMSRIQNMIREYGYDLFRMMNEAPEGEDAVRDLVAYCLLSLGEQRRLYMLTPRDEAVELKKEWFHAEDPREDGYVQGHGPQPECGAFGVRPNAVEIDEMEKKKNWALRRMLDDASRYGTPEAEDDPDASYVNQDEPARKKYSKPIITEYPLNIPLQNAEDIKALRNRVAELEYLIRGMQV